MLGIPYDATDEEIKNAFVEKTQQVSFAFFILGSESELWENTSVNFVSAFALRDSVHGLLLPLRLFFPLPLSLPHHGQQLLLGSLGEKGILSSQANTSFLEGGG